MKDLFGREVDYLRISITDLCNFRCVYCMPEKGVEKLCHSEILTPERIQEIVQEYTKLGIRKVRITGGEPLVRKGVVDICRLIKEIPEIEELCLTTNGFLLEEFADDLKKAGVDRYNVSLDTLDENKFRKITRNGDLKKVLRGIQKLQQIGYKNTKINVVLIKNFNDDEIEKFVSFAGENHLTVRFIELMPIGEAKTLAKSAYLSNQIILDKIPSLKKIKSDGASVYYQVGDSDSYIGLISPLSKKFCKSCSRMRLTADGKLKPCLHSKEEIDTNNLHKEQLLNVLKKAILAKPKEHHLVEEGSSSLRKMNKIGG